MKKKGYYEYIPQIYPRRLWVMYNTSEEGIDKCFTDIKGKPLVHNDEPMNKGNYGGMVYDECMSKVGNHLGNLVVFPKKKNMTMKSISHEAFHVLSSINDACDLEMSIRHTLWGGYVIASTRLVWVLVILLKLKI